MRTLSPYSIGETPTFDPCEKCIIKVNCSQICDGKLRYDNTNKKPKIIKIKLNRRRSYK